MRIRKARMVDAKGIVETHHDAIHNTAKTDYDKTILDAWHSVYESLGFKRIGYFGLIFSQ